MLTKVTKHGITLNMVYGRKFIPGTTNFLDNFIQTYETEIAEYALEIEGNKNEKVVILDKGNWHPKRLLGCFSDHLLKIIKQSVSVKCIFTIGMYQKKLYNAEPYDYIQKFIEIICDYGAPKDDIKKLLIESIRNLEDRGIRYDKEEGDIYMCINRTEILFKDREKKHNISKYKEDVCVVCMINKPDILFCNCGHLIVCDECYQKLENDKCLKCRKENDIIWKI